MMNLEEMLGKVTDFIHAEANTRSVVGQEIKLGEFTCVPVIKVGIGFGSGGGGKSDTIGGGAGGAIGMQPIGFLVSGNGEVRFISTAPSSAVDSVISRVPDMVEKFMEMKKEKKEGGSEENQDKQ